MRQKELSRQTVAVAQIQSSGRRRKTENAATRERPHRNLVEAQGGPGAERLRGLRMRLVRSPAGPASACAPENQGAPRMSATPYPPTGDPAVLSAMGGLTAGFGMGPGDPPLHGRAHAGRSRKSSGFQRASERPGGRMASLRSATIKMLVNMKSSGY